MSSITNNGVYYNGELVWKNPTPERGITQSITINNDKVYIDGVLVYSNEKKSLYF